MNVELPPFRNEEHISESASTINRVITLLTTNFSWANTRELTHYLRYSLFGEMLSQIQ